MILTRSNNGEQGSVTEGASSSAVAGKSGRCRVLYIINALTRGGAELGLQMLIEQGLFDEVHLELLLIHEGDEQLLQTLRSHPHVAKVYIADAHQGLRPLGMIKALFFLLRYCAGKRCDMMIASLAQANIISLLVAKLFPSIKMISFFHNSAYSKAVYEKVVRALSKRIDHCFYDNAKTRDAIVARLPSKPGRQWLYLPLFMSQQSVIKSDYSVVGPVQILSVGRLNPQKNYVAALEAVAKLVAEGLDIRLLIAGEGELEPSLLARCEQLGLNEQVELLGFCKWQQLVDEVDIYLLSSTREGLSIATVEAMSYGLPVVATNVGGVQEYGEHMRNMVVVEAPTAQAIASGLRAAIGSAQLREELGHAARATATELFGRDAVTAQYAQVKQALFAQQRI